MLRLNLVSAATSLNTVCTQIWATKSFDLKEQQSNTKGKCTLKKTFIFEFPLRDCLGKAHSLCFQMCSRWAVPCRWPSATGLKTEGLHLFFIIFNEKTTRIFSLSWMFLLASAVGKPVRKEPWKETCPPPQEPGAGLAGAPASWGLHMAVVSERLVKHPCHSQGNAPKGSHLESWVSLAKREDTWCCHLLIPH